MANQKNSDSKPASFEDSLRELEEIVSQLEAGERPLDESLALYEKGVAALKNCHTVLDKAEKRIRMLVQTGDEETALKKKIAALVRRPGQGWFISSLTPFTQLANFIFLRHKAYLWPSDRLMAR